MPLTFSGDFSRTEDATIYGAKSPDGTTVLVRVAMDVLRDYGEADVLNRASRKYDDGRYEVKDSIPTMLVRDSDML